VHLIGWAGTANAGIGRKLAATLRWRFVDLDDAIVQRAGMPITHIVAEQGPCLFHAIEGEVLHRLCFDGEPKVLATGGRTILRAPNRQRITGSGLVVWLDADGLAQRCDPIDAPWADLHVHTDQLAQDDVVVLITAALV